MLDDTGWFAEGWATPSTMPEAGYALWEVVTLNTEGVVTMLVTTEGGAKPTSGSYFGLDAVVLGLRRVG